MSATKSTLLCSTISIIALLSACAPSNSAAPRSGMSPRARSEQNINAVGPNATAPNTAAPSAATPTGGTKPAAAVVAIPDKCRITDSSKMSPDQGSEKLCNAVSVKADQKSGDIKVDHLVDIEDSHDAHVFDAKTETKTVVQTDGKNLVTLNFISDATTSIDQGSNLNTVQLAFELPDAFDKIDISTLQVKMSGKAISAEAKDLSNRDEDVLYVLENVNGKYRLHFLFAKPATITTVNFALDISYSTK